MESIACSVCGRLQPKNRMIRRRLNGKERFFCSIPCEVSWEKVNLTGVCG